VLGRLLPLQSLSADDIAAWRDLAERSEERSPVMEVDSFLAVRDRQPEEEIMIGIAAENERWYGCMPNQQSQPRRDRMKLHVVERALGSATTQTRRCRYDLAPLLDGDFAAPTLSALLQALQQTYHGVLHIEDIRGGGVAEAALAEALNHTGLVNDEVARWTRPSLARDASGNSRAPRTLPTRRAAIVSASDAA
jgi:hypothetical protein